MKTHPFVVHQWTTPLSPPKKKRTHAPFLSGWGRCSANVGRFPHWNLRITRPHGVGPRVLRDGVFQTVQRGQTKKKTPWKFSFHTNLGRQILQKRIGTTLFRNQKKENGVKLLCSCACLNSVAIHPRISTTCLDPPHINRFSFAHDWSAANCFQLPTKNGHLLAALRKHSPCGPVKMARLSP